MIDNSNLNPLSIAEVIRLPKEDALEKFKEYSAAVKRSHSAMDRLMVQTFRALSKGLGVINVLEAIKKAGVTEDYKPKLAIMRADQPMVHFHRASAGAGRYSFSERYYLTRNSRKAQNARLQFVIPENTFPCSPGHSQWPGDYWWALHAPVPPIPPAHRPADAYSKYCILWEVEKWEAKAPPADPMLLRPLGQSGLYVVLAHWDLTPIERMVLGGLLGQ